MKAEIRKEYQRWVEQCSSAETALYDADVVAELKAMAADETKIEDAFYRDLAFGTGGLRGVIGAGTNRMNVYTVAKASQGLADYVKKNFGREDWKIAVSYDSRIKSDRFAQVASGVFAANGIQVWIYPELMPTPCLSYAVRALGCAAGIMVTASHNPSKYNGYKVYGADGCQITTEAAAEILGGIERLDIFDDIQVTEFAAESSSDVVETENDMRSGKVAQATDSDAGKISYIPAEVYTAFVEEVKKQSVLFDDEIDRNVSIVYSPLNGTGLKPVLRTLKESGFTNITVVAEQEQPDGHFPTCPYPNPEIREAMALGMEYAAKYNADLLLATDPDCDRVGIAVKKTATAAISEGAGNNNADAPALLDAGNKNTDAMAPEGAGSVEAGSQYVLLSGNETGMLLLDFICSQRIRHGQMPENPVLVKTIVTIDMAERIAKKYGVRTVNVLTGFKFIGEQIGLLEKQGRTEDYLLGFEESYGYLSGTYVRDKDAVDASLLICEMFAYYRMRGISLLDRLEELYREFGYCLNTLYSFEFEGSAGFARMQEIMAEFRKGIDAIGPKKVERVLDYREGLDGLPKSDVLKYMLEDDCSVVVRPSGTEPKLKTYISVSAVTKEEAGELEKQMAEAMKAYFR
ncbi:MAG: phospho-sugar mutase [Clostridiales bacterium]|nr:phospho-sugar mutase [Clostridiales bacterium]